MVFSVPSDPTFHCSASERFSFQPESSVAFRTKRKIALHYGIHLCLDGSGRDLTGEQSSVLFASRWKNAGSGFLHPQVTPVTSTCDSHCLIDLSVPCSGSLTRAESPVPFCP